MFPKRKRPAVLIFAIVVAGGLIIPMLLLPGTRGFAEPPAPTGREQQLGQLFDELLREYGDVTFEELQQRLPVADYRTDLPFDARDAGYFELVDYRLKLTTEEKAKLTSQGMVILDQGQQLSFPAAYRQVYTSDLPVLITSDSILHAVHRSYDKILIELETTWFRRSIEDVLANCQSALRERLPELEGPLRENARDVDLYLGVARRLLHIEPSPETGNTTKGKLGQPTAARAGSTKNAEPRQWSVAGQDTVIEEIVRFIDSYAMQRPCADSTSIFGGRRTIDYSQFRPRGHYTESEVLASYFRCMSWLGREDCGWRLVPRKTECQEFDSVRELRNAVLLTELLSETNGLEQLREMDTAVGFLVGRSDNMTVFDLQDTLANSGFRSINDVTAAESVALLQRAISDHSSATSLIHSHAARSSKDYSGRPEAVFQLFGQRFVIGSFVLSRVVHDKVVALRYQPKAMDVMAAFGNNEAVGLLQDEIRKWGYAENLLACHEVVERLPDSFWSESLHHMWIASLRTLDEDVTDQPHIPVPMKTEQWQRKQLQTQLASWAELRHDNILYAKQSYTVPGCAFPLGYVEPYPEFYGTLGRMAEAAGDVFRQLSFSGTDEEHETQFEKLLERHVTFFQQMSETLKMLETIAQGEREGRQQSIEEREFLQSTFDDSASRRYGSSSQPDFDGWYCRLYYERAQNPDEWEAMQSKPVVADVHTDVFAEEVLEVATGDARLMVLVAGSVDSPTVFVGPVFTYHEFLAPASSRMTDEDWRKRLVQSRDAPVTKRNETPADPVDPATQPPDWAGCLLASRQDRKPTAAPVTVQRLDLQQPPQELETEDREFFARMIARMGPRIHVTDRSSIWNGGESQPLTDETLQAATGRGEVRSLDLSDAPITMKSLEALRGQPDLRSLNLAGTPIDDEAIRLLTEHRYLQSLNLSRTQVGDAALSLLSDLKFLSELDLQETNVSEEAIQQFRTKSPHTFIRH